MTSRREGHQHDRNKRLCRTRGRREAFPLADARPALKLLGRETNESIMLFEETLPAGTKSLFHLHHDSDEVAWVMFFCVPFL